MDNDGDGEAGLLWPPHHGIRSAIPDEVTCRHVGPRRAELRSERSLWDGESFPLEHHLEADPESRLVVHLLRELETTLSGVGEVETAAVSWSLKTTNTEPGG